MQQQPFIGVICDASFSVLAGRIKGAGYRIARVSPTMLVFGSRPPVDIWVVDCEDGDAVAEAMAELEAPVVALSNRPPIEDREAYRAWTDRIIRTLDKWTAAAWHRQGVSATSSPEEYTAVKGVWLLAGSAGAEAAVAEFFDAMPWVPPVAFLYAQHVDPADQLALTNRLGKINRHLTCTLAVGRHWFNPGQLLVVPSSCRLQFGTQGEVFSLRDTWSGRWDPHIDHLMMAATGIRPAGIIMFSGGSTDGLKGAQAMRALRVPVWAQEPDTATEPGLPRWIDRLFLASNVGSPAELAGDFMELYAEQVEAVEATLPEDGALSA